MINYGGVLSLRRRDLVLEGARIAFVISGYRLKETIII